MRQLQIDRRVTAVAGDAASARHRTTDFAASQRIVDWIKGLPAQ